MASYAHGVTPLGEGLYAYLQPDGSWGLNNAGLITSQGQSLLVDTLYDLGRTRRMLAELARVEPAAQRIDTLVNTHANGDHCWGNQLVHGAEIVASEACAQELMELDPALLASLVKSDRLGESGDYLRAAFGAFDFEGIVLTPPTRTFRGSLTLNVGSREVRLIEVGPAHTRGDLLVHVPDARTVFTGDILFIGGTPIVWAGPISNWIKACDLILELDVETVVPGHGPITDKAGVREVRDYLGHVDSQAERRFAAGMSVEDAARDIALGEFAGWGEPERIAVNVATKYRELAPDAPPLNVIELFGLMARLTR
jgi:glyoxylase-like metal-dependent hydrolase (beta-lactamase superfamily II)